MSVKMSMMTLAYLSPLLIASLISVGSVFYLNKNFERTKALRILNVFLITLAIWIFTHVLELWSTGFSASAFWDSAQFLVVSILSICWFVFALEYTGRGEWTNKRNIFLISIIPIVILILLLTNSYHHFFYESLTLQKIGPLSNMLNEGKGLFFWLFGAYIHSLLIIGVLMIVFRLISLGRVYFKQAIILAIAFSLPEIGYVLFSVGSNRFVIYNPTPVLITVAILALVWNVTKFRFLDVMPLARTIVFEEIRDAVVVLDKQGRIVDLNNPAEKLMERFGQTSKDSIGEELGAMLFIDLDLPPSKDSYEGPIEVGLTQGEETTVFELRKVPLRNVEDKYIGTVVIFRDITERKEVEEREEFLHSLLRHDLGNKLQIVRNSLELMQDYELSEGEEKLINMAMVAGEKGFGLIDKIQTLRKVPKEEKEPIEAGSIIDKVVNVFEPRAIEKGLEINKKRVECKVIAGSLLEELFSNLLENSIKHSDGNEIKISAQDSEDECIITIEDDGRGIPDKDKEKIFERDYKKGPKSGSGLGMYSVKRIAESYGGDVIVKDSDLGGARFDVKLKAA